MVLPAGLSNLPPYLSFLPFFRRAGAKILSTGVLLQYMEPKITISTILLIINLLTIRQSAVVANSSERAGEKRNPGVPRKDQHPTKSKLERLQVSKRMARVPKAIE